MKNLNLKKQSITELSSKEMEDVDGGRGWWSNFRTGNCNYSQTEGNQISAPSCDDVHEHITIGCIKR